MRNANMQVGSVCVLARASITRIWTRVVIVALVISCAQGCTSWRTRPLTPESFPARDSLRIVRVTLTDGTRLRLRNLQLAQDSLHGVDVHGARPVALPRADVERLQTRSVDVGKNLGLLLAVGAAISAALLIAVAQSF